MRALLCCAVTLLALATVCNAACYFKELVVVNGALNSSIGCEDEEGNFRVFGSEWQENCRKCSCSEDGAECCDMILGRVLLPDECEMIVDREKCSSKFVLKCDNTKECPFV